MLESIINQRILEPWETIDKNQNQYSHELQLEINKTHILHQKNVLAIARKCDDVLFELFDSDDKFAVVHLTWSGQLESSEKWPITVLYSNFDEWFIKRMIPDLIEYSDELESFKVEDILVKSEIEIALYGQHSTAIIQGAYLVSKKDISISFKVKKIENINSKNNKGKNPWIIIDVYDWQHETFINNEFYVINER